MLSFRYDSITALRHQPPPSPVHHINRAPLDRTVSTHISTTKTKSRSYNHTTKHRWNRYECSRHYAKHHREISKKQTISTVSHHRQLLLLRHSILSHHYISNNRSVFRSLLQHSIPGLFQSTICVIVLNVRLVYWIHHRYCTVVYKNKIRHRST